MKINNTIFQDSVSEGQQSRVHKIGFGNSTVNAKEIWFTTDDDHICLYFTRSEIGWWSDKDQRGGVFATC